MQISSSSSAILSQFSSYSIKQSQNMSQDQAEMIISAGNQIKQAPINTKMVNQLNKSMSNTGIDIYA